MYQIRIGCQLNYLVPATTPSVFIVAPPPHPRQLLSRENFDAAGAAVTGTYVDGFGNRCQRVSLTDGEAVVRYDALATVPRDPDVFRPDARAIPPQELPSELLRFTLPSRYAETDELLGFAWERFARVPAGWERARAICEWTHRNVEYRPGSSGPDWSAADVIARRQGVCRDRAHVVVALCRAFNMPARYAVSYLPDIDVPDDGATMDFHAYAEVWLEGGWYVFDPHGLAARKGRVFIASGLDAADAAFATLYGAAALTRLRVWADPVSEAGTTLSTQPMVERPQPPAPVLTLPSPPFVAPASQALFS